MTPRQIELARHALGLPNRTKQSYRNRFVASAGHGDFADWEAMVAEGVAKRDDGPTFCFWLTLEGAHNALLKGERLDLEDFPSMAQREAAAAPPKPVTATARERDCLKLMHEYSPHPDGGMIFYAHITDALNIEIGQARRAVRALVRKGLASRETCFDDDGFIQGSGFSVTAAGASYIEATAESA